MKIIKILLEFVIYTVGIISLALVIMATVFCVTSLMEQKACQERCFMNDYVCHYSMFTGCLVNSGGKWLEYELANKGK